MTKRDFLNIVHDMIGEILEKIDSKGKEYSRNDDRFHNFIRGGLMYGITKEQYLLYLMSKHIISINDMVKDLEVQRFSDSKQWLEKITDIIIYLMLLYAMQIEREKVSIDSVEDEKFYSDLSEKLTQLYEHLAKLKGIGDDLFGRIKN